MIPNANSATVARSFRQFGGIIRRLFQSRHRGAIDRATVAHNKDKVFFLTEENQSEPSAAARQSAAPSVISTNTKHKHAGHPRGAPARIEDMGLRCASTAHTAAPA